MVFTLDGIRLLFLTGHFIYQAVLSGSKVFVDVIKCLSEIKLNVMYRNLSKTFLFGRAKNCISMFNKKLI